MSPELGSEGCKDGYEFLFEEENQWTITAEVLST